MVSALDGTAVNLAGSELRGGEAVVGAGRVVARSHTNDLGQLVQDRSTGLRDEHGHRDRKCEHDEQR
jgi:hypothetical protein